MLTGLMQLAVKRLAPPVPLGQSLVIVQMNWEKLKKWTEEMD